jgi:hypothetical protein
LDTATINVTAILALAIGLSVAWHAATRNHTLACVGAAVSAALCAAAINVWWLGYAPEMVGMTLVSTFALGFILALGVGALFRRLRARSVQDLNPDGR